MKTFNLRFSLTADMFVDVEADTEEEAFNKLRSMSAFDLFEVGYVRDSEVSEEEVVEIKEERRTFTAKVLDVEWPDECDLRPMFIVCEELTAINYHGAVGDDEIRDAIEDDLWRRFGDIPKSFRYEIIDRN